ncbi:MAG TPA: type II toxin-antitoxin system RelE/ParE family toxin [Caulobacteraceae bacterium]|nr:type II toxin-antitoxin system RelE/ParE family toxin [Caulobacteraceae bacterium]
MMEKHPPEIPVFFYQTTAGGEPVLDWLRSLPPEDRRAIGTDLATVQFGWPIGMPLCRPLGSGLWEVRTSLPSRRISRLVFFIDHGRIGVVHGFIKKTQKTPAEDLEIARKRMKEMKA